MIGIKPLFKLTFMILWIYTCMCFDPINIFVFVFVFVFDCRWRKFDHENTGSFHENREH